MKDELQRIDKNTECVVINLQNSNESGINWVAYYKNNDKKYYFDSYGDVLPPKNLLNN